MEAREKWICGKVLTRFLSDELLENRNKKSEAISLGRMKDCLYVQEINSLTSSSSPNFYPIFLK